MKTKNQISRRGFLRAAGLLAAGTVAGTGVAKKSSTKKSKKEADEIGINVPSTDKTDETTRLFRFVQVSDTQPKEEDHWQKTSEAIDIINNLKPAFVIMPGDITWSGTEKECKRMKRLLGKVKAPLHLVPGNHDTTHTELHDPFADSKTPEEFHRRKMKIYNKHFGEEQWSFEYDNFQFVGIDSTKSWPKLQSETKSWLKKTFADSSKPYKFVVVHFINDEPYNWDKAFFGSTQTFNTDLDKIMSEAGAIGYMHGHNHMVQAYRDANTGRFIFSSASTVFNEKYGVMYFDVYKDSMICFWQPTKGDTIPLGIFDLKEAVAGKGKKLIKNLPVVSQINPTDATIEWQTNPNLETSLNFRKTDDKKWINQPVTTKPDNHKVKIKKLSPNTKYQFYVNAETYKFGKLRSEIVSFKTPDR